MNTAPLIQAVEETLGLLEQALVGGLARPDVDLASDLAEGSARLAGLGMPGGAARLAGLGQAVARVAGAANASVAIGEAWVALQGAVAWARLARREVALAAVAARLSQDAAVARGERVAPIRPPTLNADVWPVGVELVGRRLTIFGRTVPEGRPVVLRDRVDLPDPSDPFAGRAISRLFQAAIDLRRTLNGLIRLVEHPCRPRGGGFAVAPAFATVPERLAVGEDFVPPQPALQAVSVQASTLRWRTESAELAPDEGLASALNAAKLLLGGRPTVRAAVAPGPDGPTLRFVHDPALGRVWPTLDLGAIRLPASHLAERLGAQAGGGLAALGLRAELAGVGGLAPGPLVAAVQAAEPGSPLDLFRVARARATLGLPAMDATCVAPHVARLADTRAPLSDRALWAVCCLAARAPEAVEGPLMQAIPRRFGAPPSDPTPLVVCARAMALWCLGALDAEAEAEVYGDGAEGSDAGAGVRGWFAAHREALRDASLTPLEQLALAVTAARLNLEPAPIERGLVLASALPALAALDGTPQAADAAADALRLLYETGSVDLLVGPRESE